MIEESGREQSGSFFSFMAMLFRRKSVRRLPCVPEGCRIYAIGDVHGRLDLLTRLIDLIERDDRSRPEAHTVLVFLGDLVDRGPDSAGVVRFVRALADEDRFEVRVIVGNHEEIFLLAATGDVKATRLLMRVGGEMTLRSYGFSEDEIERGGFHDLARTLRERAPTDDLAFLRGGEDMIVIGDFAFVHAGVRPGIPLSEQDATDLRWIRSEFLDSVRDHGKVVVHGHTPADDVEDRYNRIGIDTGAYTTGRLSAVGLNGDRRWFLTAHGEQDTAHDPEQTDEYPL